jgi:hypothetical protein
MAGAVDWLGLDALERDDDPWDGIHIVAPFSLPMIADMLGRVQDESRGMTDKAPSPRLSVY